jgi:hypothetical protein
MRDANRSRFSNIILDGATSRLVWRGCRVMRAGQVGNAVATFADGTLLVTVLTRPGTTIGDFMLGKPTGAVWQWRVGDDRFREVRGTALPGNNGLEVDPDERHFYVVRSAGTRWWCSIATGKSRCARS